MTGIDQETRRLKFGQDPEEEALRWITRSTSGEMSDAEIRAFERWRQDPENARYYAEVESILGDMDRAVRPPDNVVQLRHRPRQLANWGRRFAAMAAGIAAMAVIGQQYLTVWQYDHATQGAARGHAELADGSKVELNTGSAIDIDYRGNERRVTLARGEAFFDVKRDPSRPFVIGAGAGEVRVLGTAFSVKREGDGARVTVIRGKVRVSAGGSHVDLTPNQQVAFGRGRNGAVAGVNAGELLSWSRGFLVFRGRPLAQVVAEIDRYYPGMIMLRNDRAGQRRIDAVVHLDRIDQWIERLEDSQNVTATRLPGVVIIS
ncbi:FecR family protein [Sphingomonas colocasiae]|uniref:FecR domain-containing protein n=1 Tax=Sphingomonas colocasiae TaxID=1848973 RepID=A0ABS7PQ33_9SPHN|nr:FecR domain-containing protein [Sphingomonas colocasiae]MBY8823434.1 FecR domain-containing protein [Sphingomonas colocasiae]